MKKVSLVLLNKVIACFYFFIDLIFLQGTEVIYKVALVLLGNHKELIMQCNGFETIVEFLKTTLPEMGIIQMERIINQVVKLWKTEEIN